MRVLALIALNLLALETNAVLLEPEKIGKLASNLFGQLQPSHEVATELVQEDSTRQKDEIEELNELHNRNIIKKLGEPLYLAAFCIGLAVLTFSIVLIWHNELRIVKFASFVS